MLKKLVPWQKKLASWDKGSWFYHDVFREEIERNKDGIDFQSDDSDNGIYSGSNDWPYVVVDLKLLQAAIY